MRADILIGTVVAFAGSPLWAQDLSREAARIMEAAERQGARITPEQAQLIADREREAIRSLSALGGRAGPAARAAPADTPLPPMSEAELGAKVAAAGRSAKRAKHVELSMEKLRVDGVPFVDPDGGIINAAEDVDRNIVTFTTRGPAGRSVVKLAALDDLGSATPVGYSSWTEVRPVGRSGDRSRQIFEGRTGVRVEGRWGKQAADGVALWDDRRVMIYRYGAGVLTGDVPAGFYPAGSQNGDVVGTGVLLIRRDNRRETANQGAVRAFKGLFSSIGAAKPVSDFALLDASNGKVMPLPIEDLGQDESMYDGPQGQSGTHYFWRARWMKLGERRFVLHFAKLKQRMLVTDLDSGKTAEAFNRPSLGIVSWTFEPNRGAGRLVARWGSQDHVIDDMVGWFDAAPPVAAPA